MKFTVNSGDMRTAAMMVAKVMSNKNAMPILDCIRIEVLEHEATLRAADKETTMIKTVQLVESDGTGVVCVGAKKLIDGLKSIPDQPITVECEEDVAMTIHYMSGKFTLPQSIADEYPELPKMSDETDVITLSAERLSNGIAKVVGAAANDEIHPVMNGVFLEAKDGVLNIVATNGHALSVVSHSEFTSSRDCGINIPKKSAMIIKDCVLDNSRAVEISFDKRNFRLECDDMVLYSRLIEGRYPNYNSVIPKEQPISVEVNRLELISALRRVTLFSSTASNLAVLKFDRWDGLDISCQDIDYSLSASEHVGSARVSDGDIKIGFKGALLTDLLSTFDNEAVTIHLTNPSIAAVMTDSTNEQKALLMPMLVD